MPRCPREKASDKNAVFCVPPVPSPPTPLSARHPWPQARGQIWAAQELLVTHSTVSAAAVGILQPLPQAKCPWEPVFFFFKDISNQTCGTFSPHDKTRETPTKKRHGACYFSAFCNVVPVSNPRVPLLPGSAVKLGKKVAVRSHRAPQRRQGRTGALEEGASAKAMMPGWGEGSLWIYSPASC